MWLFTLKLRQQVIPKTLVICFYITKKQKGTKKTLTTNSEDCCISSDCFKWSSVLQRDMILPRNKREGRITKKTKLARKKCPATFQQEKRGEVDNSN